MSIASLPVAANPGPHAQALATGLDSVILQGEVTIVQGTVLRIASAFEGDLIFSYVTVMVAEVVSGLDSLRGIEIIVRHLGGEVNGVLLWASDQPYFAIGEIVQLSVRLEGDYYVAISPKTTVAPPPDAFPTAEGYRLYWYHPSLGWRYQASSPGSGWYGPAKWFGGGFTYYVNTANTPTSVGSANFISAVQVSYQTWEDDPGSSVDLTYGGTTSGTVDNHDQVPRVGWGPIGGSTIAYTHIWMTLGSGYTLPMDDADMVFDTTKSWSVTGAPGTYDVQNIGTHEAGHAIGLADLYDSEDSEQTMFGYASTGETKKRTLEWGDRAGVAALYPVTVTVTVTSTKTSTQSSTLYSYRTTTTTVTSYTSTSTLTSIVPTFTTVALLLSTVTSVVQSVQYLTSTLTTTVTSYTGTQTSMSTIVVPTTVTVGPSTSTSTVETTKVLTSTGTITETSYTTRTVTSYTGTQISTSTIPAVTTVVLVPLTTTSTVQNTQFLTSTATTTVTSYTATTTSTSTSVVYTTVTQAGAGAGPSSSLAYLSFISLLAITLGDRIAAGKGWRIPKVRSLMERRYSRS